MQLKLRVMLKQLLRRHFAYPRRQDFQHIDSPRSWRLRLKCSSFTRTLQHFVEQLKGLRLQFLIQLAWVRNPSFNIRGAGLGSIPLWGSLTEVVCSTPSEKHNHKIKNKQTHNETEQTRMNVACLEETGCQRSVSEDWRLGYEYMWHRKKCKTWSCLWWWSIRFCSTWNLDYIDSVNFSKPSMYILRYFHPAGKWQQIILLTHKHMGVKAGTEPHQWYYLPTCGTRSSTPVSFNWSAFQTIILSISQVFAMGYSAICSCLLFTHSPSATSPPIWIVVKGNLDSQLTATSVWFNVCIRIYVCAYTLITNKPIAKKMGLGNENNTTQ